MQYALDTKLLLHSDIELFALQTIQSDFSYLDNDSFAKAEPRIPKVGLSVYVYYFKCEYFPSNNVNGVGLQSI